MKLGEIKIEALKLMFAGNGQDYNDPDINQLERMKQQQEYKDYLGSMNGSINRCFAVLEERLEGDVVNADGTLATNVIGADVSKYNLGAFELKITGFVTDNHKNAKIVYGAYVIAQDDDGKEISYMQAGVPTGDSKYYSASYNDIVNK